MILQYGGKNLFVGLGAKKILAAEKYGEKIAVEIKTFLGRSAMYELEKAVGQYIVYRNKNGVGCVINTPYIARVHLVMG